MNRNIRLLIILFIFQSIKTACQTERESENIIHMTKKKTVIQGGINKYGGPVRKICEACPQDHKERPNDRVLFNFLSYNFNVNFCIQ